MNSEYQSVYRHADALRRRFRDVVDDGNDHEAKALYRSLDNLAEDFEKQKNPRTLEQSTRRVAEEFKDAKRHTVEFMSANHLQEFYEKLEEITHELRKFENY